MKISNNLTKISALTGFFLGLIIILFYNFNNKIGSSGIIYLIIIVTSTTIYGYLIGFLYKIFKNKNWLHANWTILYILLLLILTVLLAFSIYVLFFALDLTSGY